MTEPVHETRPTEEKTLFRARTHAKILVPALAVQAALLVAHVAIWKLFPSSTPWPWLDAWGPVALHSIILTLEVYYVVVPFLRWWHTVFTITDKRIVMTWGILRKQTRELMHSRISSVDVDRGLLDRMVGCGTILLYDAGGPVPVALNDVPRVHHVRDMVNRLRFTEGDERGTVTPDQG